MDLGTHFKSDLNENSINNLISISLYSDWRAIIVSSEPVSSSFWKVCVFPFPQCTLTLVKTMCYFGEKIKFLT